MADFPLTSRDRLDRISDVVEAEINWPQALRATENSAAVSALRSIVLGGLRTRLWRSTAWLQPCRRIHCG
jgi:hypothetical protein